MADLSSLPDLRDGAGARAPGDARPLAGRVGDAEVVLLRHDQQVVALGGRCPHAGAPLAQGLVLDGCLRCPWHHARFALQDGAAVAGPTLLGLRRWQVSVERGGRHGRWVVGPELPPVPPASPPLSPRRVWAVGGGPAALSYVASLRALGHRGDIGVVAAEPQPFIDRTSLSKAFLAGDMATPPAALPAPQVAALGCRVYPGRRVRAVQLARGAQPPDGRGQLRVEGAASGGPAQDPAPFDAPFDALLLAPGAAPRPPALPGADAAHVHVLREVADARRLRDRLAVGAKVVLVGGSFISLEAAAALASRGVRAHVVAPDAAPLARVIGPVLALWLRRHHEAHGVRFTLGARLAGIDGGRVLLDDGSTIDKVDQVLLGMGVAPQLALAQEAGLACDDGIVVDGQMRTSAPGVWAAGDAACQPAAPFGARRPEHWSVAVGQGRRAARSTLGLPPEPPAPPFFWSRHYDRTLAMVGHASPLEHSHTKGCPAAGSAATALYAGGRMMALAAVGRAALRLRCEAALEAGRPWEMEALFAAEPS